MTNLSPGNLHGPLDVLFELRTATRADHEAVEALLDLERADFGLAHYRAFLEVMLDAHEPVETALARLPALHTHVPDLGARAKTAHLRADLLALGRVPRRAPARTLDLGEALGALYVLEGSTLGARFIQERVHAALGSACGATRYLDACAIDRSQRWRDFGLAVTRAARHAEMRASIVRGARSTFALVRARLSENR